MTCESDAFGLSGLAGRPFVVAGSGPSLNTFERERVSSDDVIVRVNNFFFEEAFTLGRRVDLLQVGGDRWIFPFYAATIRRILSDKDYDISAWSTHQPHVMRRGRRELPLPFVPLTYRDDQTKAEIEALVRSHDKIPTTGLLALINAHGLGASSVTLVGIDLYSGDDRYGFSITGHSAALLNEHRSYNKRFHSQELDLAIIRYLVERGGLPLYRAADDIGELGFLPLAPVRAAPIPAEAKTRRYGDWVRWAGIWPIEGMRLARGLYQMHKTLLGKFSQPD